MIATGLWPVSHRAQRGGYNYRACYDSWLKICSGACPQSLAWSAFAKATARRFSFAEKAK